MSSLFKYGRKDKRRSQNAMDCRCVTPQQIGESLYRLNNFPRIIELLTPTAEAAASVSPSGSSPTNTTAEAATSVPPSESSPTMSSKKRKGAPKATEEMKKQSVIQVFKVSAGGNNKEGQEVANNHQLGDKPTYDMLVASLARIPSADHIGLTKKIVCDKMTAPTDKMLKELDKLANKDIVEAGCADFIVAIVDYVTRGLPEFDDAGRPVNKDRHLEEYLKKFNVDDMLGLLFSRDQEKSDVFEDKYHWCLLGWEAFFAAARDLAAVRKEVNGTTWTSFADFLRRLVEARAKDRWTDIKYTDPYVLNDPEDRQEGEVICSMY